MDWDGIGTFALFLSSGAVGLGLIALRAYKAKLTARLERERLRHVSGPSDELTEQLRDLETQVSRLAERVDFTERLLGSGQQEPAESEKAT